MKNKLMAIWEIIKGNGVIYNVEISREGNLINIGPNMEVANFILVAGKCKV